MKELSDIYKERGKQFIEDLFKDFLVVSEKLAGSSFAFEKKGNSIEFYKGSGDRPINMIDRTLMMYYEKPIQYIKNVSSTMMASIPENWRFCFQYFVHNQPNVITYDKIPSNHLVLTHIKVMSPNGKLIKIIEDPRVIKDWSSAIGVTPLLPIFKGYLTTEQKEKLKTFIETPKEDQREIFQTSSFAEYLIRTLNPNIDSTILHDDLKKPIDSIIFRFYKPGTSQSFSAKMIDPYTINLMKDKEPIDLKKQPADINEILLLDLLAFIEERGLKKHEVLNSTPDERYIELVSNIFNDYIIRKGSDIKNIDIEKADFAKGDEFNLNIDLIPGQMTRNYLQGNETLQNLFKIMLGSLRKKRNPDKAGNIMTPSVINDFNQMVDKINDVVEVQDDGKFKTFDDYLKIKSTNESLLATAEELVLEEKVLNYNSFINLGKVVVEAEGKTLVRNKKTGDEYEVKNPDPKKHEIVEPKDKESKSTDEMPKSLEKKFTEKRTEKIKSDYTRIAFANKEDKEAFTKGFDKVLSGQKLSKEEAEVVSKYAKLSDSKGKVKIYFASSEPGVFSQYNREKVMDLDDKKGEAVDALKEIGLEVTSATTVGGGAQPKIASKQINPNKISGGKTYKSKVETKKNENGEITEVKVGSTSIKRYPMPDEGKLTEDINESFKKQNPDLDDKEIARLVNRTSRAIERHNRSLEKWASLKDVEMIETVPGLDDLPQKERAEKIQKEYPKQITKKMRELMGDNPTEREEELLKSIEDLSNIESPEEFDKAFTECLRKMDDIESVRKGSADLAESFAYMSMNKKGYRTELPAGENFPVADIICLGADIDIDPNDPDYTEKVAMQGLGFAVNLETMGGVSVKKDGGAASALDAKIDESSFKNPETADKLKGLAGNHNNFLGTIKEPTTPETIKKGDKLLDETEDWAVKNGILNKDDLPLKYGNRTAEEWADDTLKKWESEGRGPFAPWQKEALAGHLRACVLIEAIHNSDLSEQNYGNINISTSKKDGGVHITDGITSASLMGASPNPGFKFVEGPDGYMIPRPNAIYSANLKAADYNPETGKFEKNK